MQVRTRSDIEALVEANMGLVTHMTTLMASRYPGHVDRDELWSAAAVGLVDAANKYDESTGVPFGSYAATRIKGSIIDSTRQRDTATRATRRVLRDAHRAEDALRQLLGRDPEAHEVAAEIGVDVDELRDRLFQADNAQALSLDVAAVEGGTDLGDLVADAVDVAGESADREAAAHVRAAIDHLNPRLRDVILRAHVNEESLASIAESLGVTGARVSQLLAEAVNAVRAMLAHNGHDDVPAVPDNAPGLRERRRYLAAVPAVA